VQLNVQFVSGSLIGLKKQWLVLLVYDEQVVQAVVSQLVCVLEFGVLYHIYSFMQADLLLCDMRDYKL
jgi:hypothetical protein